jgi:hypothetical protein
MGKEFSRAYANLLSSVREGDISKIEKRSTWVGLGVD